MIAAAASEPPTSPGPEGALAQKIFQAMELAYQQIAAAASEPPTSPAAVPEGTLAQKKAALRAMETACQQIAAVAIPPETHSGEVWDAARAGLDFAQRCAFDTLEMMRRIVDKPQT